MLFNSYVFVFAFLPITLAGFFAVARFSDRRGAIFWLVAASLLYYAWWNPAYAPLLLFSVLFNYAVGLLLAGKGSEAVRRAGLFGGISVDLALLAYYKYANFFLDVVGGGRLDIVLPLAISFFTFQQIAYLVDAWRRETEEHDFIDYCLFVTFFPQLIAGPIVHHKEMLPQFREDRVYQFHTGDFSVGLTMFLIGLGKKVLIADTCAQWVDPVFAQAEAGQAIPFAAAWIAALSWSFQLYYDFCAYSDMALGLGRMVGVQLPLNFDSPYKSQDIVEFWRRWHITLSRFLRDYLYIPLGGNRHGSARRYLNLMITMTLGGLWHGAGWTYVLFGFLHGGYLIVNHGWRSVAPRLGFVDRTAPRWVWLNRLLTFQAVVWSFVVFRAESVAGAGRILWGMYGGNGFALTAPYALRYAVLLNALLLPWVFLGPHTQQVMRRYEPCLDSASWQQRWSPVHPRLDFVWTPTRRNAVLLAVVSVFTVLGMSRVVEFVYFQF